MVTIRVKLSNGESETHEGPDDRSVEQSVKASLDKHLQSGIMATELIGDNGRRYAAHYEIILVRTTYGR